MITYNQNAHSKAFAHHAHILYNVCVKHTYAVRYDICAIGSRKPFNLHDISEVTSNVTSRRNTVTLVRWLYRSPEAVGCSDNRSTLGIMVRDGDYLIETDDYYDTIEEFFMAHPEALL